MPDNFIKSPTKSYLNKTSIYISPSKKTDKKNSFINTLLLIENNSTSLNKINSISSSLREMSDFLKKIKCKLLGKEPNQTPTDIELDRVLSQGKIISAKVDVIHCLLNNKSDTTPTPPSLSLTTKTGIVLGGILLSSSFAGGNTDSFQRTRREQRHDIHHHANNSGRISSMPLSSYHLHNTFNTQLTINPYHNLSETRDTFFAGRRKMNSMIKSAMPNRRIKNIDNKKNNVNIPPCPPIDGRQKKTTHKSLYIYTTKQPAICLTETFNKSCQKGHRDRIAKRNCHDIPRNMILKKKETSCFCPPPDWLNLKIVTPQQINKFRPCPSVDGKRKTKISTGSYIYATKQPTTCLTDAFNIICQKKHRERTNKSNCHTIPSSMVLKLKETFCMCPPPDWFEIKIREPSPSDIKEMNHKIYITSTVTALTTTPPTTLMPKNTNITLPTILPENDKTFKNRTANIYEYRLSPKTNHTILPASGDSKKLDEVQKISTLSCYQEREKITTSKAARIISNTIYRPLSTLFNEGKVVIEYSILEKGCLNNTEFHETSKKIESVIETILFSLPKNKEAQILNRLRFVTRLIAGLLELYADSEEGKKINENTVLDLFSELLGLTKDTVSSLLTQDIERISKSSDDKEIADITKSLKYQNNQFIITGRDGKKIKIQRELNHFYDPDSKGFVFYDHEKKWYVDNNIESTRYIRKTFQRAKEVWPDTENISFYKNSTPELYGYNVIIKHNNDIYALIDNNFYLIDEIQLTDTIFRYITKNKFNLPIVHGENGWIFEDISSHSSSIQIQSFIKTNENIKNNLVSKHINHQDVTPLALDTGLQFDKNLSEYLKINGEYFLIKKYQDTSHYIEGLHSTLALEMINNQYHIKESFFDDICCFHKESLGRLGGVNPDNKFLIDNTVISHIKSQKFLSDSRNIMTQEDVIEVDLFPSAHIEGAIANNGRDYFYYDDMFIHIHSNNDNTYILGDINDNENNILLYKSPESKVYYKIPKSRNQWQDLIGKKNQCKVKKEALSICIAPYFETRLVNSLVNNYINEGIVINNHAEQLEPYDSFRGIYRSRRGDNENLYYYTGEDNIFLYARPRFDTSSHIVPVVFTLYGKDSHQQINLNAIISNISIVKDFHTKKIIICTPEEAQSYIFDIKRKEYSLHLQWQGTEQFHPEATAWDLAAIQIRIPHLRDISSLDELFYRSGKKIITAPGRIAHNIKMELNSLLQSPFTATENFIIKNLKDIVHSSVPSEIKNICDQAFKKAIYNINEAIITMKHSSRSVNNYITHTLKISDTRARDKFFLSLERQLEIMKMVFSEEHKENIMIISKRIDNLNSDILSDKGKNTIGFNIQHDPFDRIYINTAMIDVFSESDLSFHINMMSDTMLHEAVHALGKTEDYIYLPINRDGHISEISTSITNIEEAIVWSYTENMNLEYLSRLYFLNHPLYNKFSISSLVKASNLLKTFRNDPFYRAIIFLNNPDTIAVIIRELAQFAPD